MLNVDHSVAHLFCSFTFLADLVDQLMQSYTVHWSVCLSVAIPTNHSFDHSGFLLGLHNGIFPP